MKVGDLVKIAAEWKHDKGANRTVGVVVEMRQHDRCQVLWANGVSSVPLCGVLDIVSKHKKDKIN